MGRPESFDPDFDEDYEVANFCDLPTYPVARKPHICSACANKIIIGEKYVQVASVSDDGWYHNRFHQGCWDGLRRNSSEPGILESSERLENVDIREEKNTSSA